MGDVRLRATWCLEFNFWVSFDIWDGMFKLISERALDILLLEGC